MKKKIDIEQLTEQASTNEATLNSLEPLQAKEDAVLEGLHKKYKVPVEDRKIVLIPKNPKMTFKGTKHYVQPPMDLRTGKVYTGQPVFTEEEKRYVPHVVEASTTRILQGRVELDLNNPIDAIDWQWLQKHPYINPQSDKALWVIEDKAVSDKEKVSKERETIKLKNAILELSLTNKRRLTRVLGGDSEGEEVSIERFLLEAVDKDIRTANNKTIKMLLEDDKQLYDYYFAYLLIDKNEITINMGSYYYQNTLIATDFDSYLLWLYNRSNQDWLNVMKTKYGKG